MPLPPTLNVVIAIGFGLNAKFSAILLIPEAADIPIFLFFKVFYLDNQLHQPAIVPITSSLTESRAPDELSSIVPKAPPRVTQIINLLMFV
ncbi:hypothetical protein [Spiroplasma endosymbiont of Polydrusus pterygomalis]|uniref:hypothetical protein n=1 Tax=Spiroplasma endosymbiont of Polydrusus pterygomalis TaxID=3139327 RepID=UPI003CCB0EF7